MGVNSRKMGNTTEMNVGFFISKGQHVCYQPSSMKRSGFFLKDILFENIASITPVEPEDLDNEKYISAWNHEPGKFHSVRVLGRIEG